MRSRVQLDGPVVGTYAALAALLPAGDRTPIRTEELVAAIGELCAFVDTRRDCADFRVIALLAVMLEGVVPDESAEAVKRSLTAFKYWMSEPGDDAMCFWSENHQLLFATGEYLAGAAFCAGAWPLVCATGAAGPAAIRSCDTAGVGAAV